MNTVSQSPRLLHPIQLFLRYTLPIYMDSFSFIPGKIPANSDEINVLMNLFHRTEPIASLGQVNRELELIQRLFPEDYQGLLQSDSKEPFGEQNIRLYFPKGYNQRIMNKGERECSEQYRPFILIQEGRVIKLSRKDYARVDFKNFAGGEKGQRDVGYVLTDCPNLDEYVLLHFGQIVERNIIPKFEYIRRAPKDSLGDICFHQR